MWLEMHAGVVSWKALARILLGSKIAVARVQGFQGEDLAATNTILACAKHFAGYAFAESGRDYNTVDISESELQNTIFPHSKQLLMQVFERL
jgi:beta-glucosidase-like glycosyl hydrolase